jgi:hypothetical protein
MWGSKDPTLNIAQYKKLIKINSFWLGEHLCFQQWNSYWHYIIYLSKVVRNVYFYSNVNTVVLCIKATRHFKV